ncbi:MAG: hypothetical protein OXC11_08675 [Rhodospirillales bacterium]|nr:hypothetical protein [Rhodospirillales bacterium]
MGARGVATYGTEERAREVAEALGLPCLSVRRAASLGWVWCIFRDGTPVTNAETAKAEAA